MAIYECEFHLSDTIDVILKRPWTYIDSIKKLSSGFHFGLKSKLKKSPILEENRRIYLDADHLKIVYWNGDINGNLRHVILVGFPYYCTRTFHTQGMEMFNEVKNAFEYITDPLELIELGRKMIDGTSGSTNKKLDRILEILEDKV